MPKKVVASEPVRCGWAKGEHLLFVESEDAAGHWGVPSGTFIYLSGPLKYHAYFPIYPH